LSRLVADGLVQASDQRGFRVSPVSHQDLLDVSRTRIDIESLALRRSMRAVAFGKLKAMCDAAAIVRSEIS
jgi:DNA-binding GntR family transcriptional regulator